MNRGLYIFLGLLAFIQFSYGQTGPFYVDDTSGNDINDGSFATPFRTIQKAVSRIASGVSVTSATCFVFPGTYNESVFILSNKNAKKMMVIQNLSNTKPVLQNVATSNNAFTVYGCSNIMISGFDIRGYVWGAVRIGLNVTTIVSNAIIRNNTIYSQGMRGIQLDYAYKCSINSNTFFGKGATDIAIHFNAYAHQSIADGNWISRFEQHGIDIQTESHSNDIRYNVILSNSQSGIKVDNLTKGHLIYRNRIAHVWQNGLNIISGGDGIMVYHNSFYSNAKSPGFSQILMAAGTVRLHNNIIANSSQWGVFVSGGTILASYNATTNNNAGNYSGVTLGNGTILTRPRYNINPSPLSSFLSLSNNSTSIDAGTNLAYPAGYFYLGTAPDLGWKESGEIVVVTPRISYFNPLQGYKGTDLRITGTNFGTTQDTRTVLINGISQTVLSWSNRVIHVTAMTEGSVKIYSNNGMTLISVARSLTNKIMQPRISAVASSGANPSYAIDGDAGSRWESATADPQWLVVDMGATKSINRVDTFWETAHAEKWVIQISNTPTGLWSTVASNSNTAVGGSWTKTNRFDTVATRHLRMYGYSRATTWGYSIWEIRPYFESTNFMLQRRSSGLANFNPVSGCSGQNVLITNGVFGPAQGNKTVTIGGVEATVTAWGNNGVHIIANNSGPIQIWTNSGNELIWNTRSLSNTHYVPVSAWANQSNSAAEGPSLVIDQDLGTDWVGTRVYPEILGINLGSAQMVDRVDFYFEAACPGKYYLQVSNVGYSGWLTVTSNTNYITGVGYSFYQTNRFNPVLAQYIRMYALNPATAWNDRVFEFIPRYEATNYSMTSSTVVIDGFSPSPARMLNLITITGSGFGAAQGSGFVKFANNVVASVYSNWSDNKIRVVLPNGAVTGKIGVTNGCGYGIMSVSDLVVQSNIYYVDKNNLSGPWDGLSWTTAYQHISNARVRMENNPGVKIYIAAGRYYEVFNLISSHSGTFGNTNLITAYTNGVVIDGQFGAANDGNGILLTGTKFIKLQKLGIQNITWDGINFADSASNAVNRCYVAFCHASGISFHHSRNDVLLNSTAWSNASGAGGGVYLDGFSTNVIIKNCIIQSNEGTGIATTTANAAILTYNNVARNYPANYATTLPGMGTITNDSIFLSLDKTSADFLKLSASSPCIDAGDPSMDSDPTRLGTHIDMGAFEYVPQINIYVSKNNPTGPWDGKSWATSYTQISGAAMTDFENSTGITMLIGAGTYKEQVDIYRAASGTHGLTNKMVGYTNGVIIDGENTRGYGIQFGPDGQIVHHIKIENIRVTRANTHGVRVMWSQSNVFSRLLVDRNRNGNRWGMFLGASRSNTIVNCTFTSNGARGLVISADAFNTHIRNSIFYRNEGGIESGAGIATRITYCDSVSNIYDGNFVGGVIPGAGMITNSPLFVSVNPSSANFTRLGIGSPCIDTGDPTDPVPAGGGTRVDMGAFESVANNPGPYYVDDDSGNDANFGTFAAPFKTLQAAADKMMQGNPYCTNPTAYIFPGIYTQAVRISGYMHKPKSMLFTSLSNTMAILHGGDGLHTNAFKIRSMTNLIIENMVFKKYTLGLGRGITSSGGATTTCNNLVIRGNAFYSNSGDGIHLEYTRFSLVSNNQLRDGGYGVFLRNSASKNTVRDNIVRQATYGIGVENSHSNIISYNLILSNTAKGFYIFTTPTGNLFYRNQVALNQQQAFYIGGAGINYLHHNSLFSNSINTGYYAQIALFDGTLYLNNNIIANSRVAGVLARSGTAIASYNNVYANESMNYSNVIIGNGSISNVPKWELSMSVISNYLTLSNGSPCIDVGTNLGYAFFSTAPDLGWKETGFVGNKPDLRISKSIESISNALASGEPIPGSKVSYHLTYSNIGTGPADNVMIFEKPSSYLLYLTNDMSLVTGWTVQFTTNSNPSQDWASTDYTNAIPSAGKAAVKWFRWKKSSVSATETGTIIFKVIIK